MEEGKEEEWEGRRRMRRRAGSGGEDGGRGVR